MTSSSSDPLLPPYSPTNPEPHALKRSYIYCHSKIRFFLASTAQHYCVLALVSLDLLSIFADILIQLYQCDFPKTSPTWNTVRDGLGIAGLAFSSLFMIELAMNVWVFGFRYFNSYFHILDATVILAGFIIDVLLHGILEEIASLVVILRLWRFFKIIEEFTVGAQEQMDALEEKVNELEKENEGMRAELRGLRS